MSTISAAAVKTLRDRTNAPMMDCKAALTQADGDMEKAIQYLRERGKAAGVKRAANETAEGRISTFVDADHGVAAIVELRCESAPVVKSEHFAALGTAIAKQVALKAPSTIEALLEQPSVDDPSKTVKDVIADTIGTIRENMKPVRFVRQTGVFGTYIHHDLTVGVLVYAEGDKSGEAVLRDVALHVAAKNPVAALREDVAPEVIAKEREIAVSQAAASGKPANIVEKIAEGKIKTWFAENVLVEQPFVKDDSKTVGELLNAGKLKLKGFTRFKVGELA